MRGSLSTQPPFPLHVTDGNTAHEAFESIRKIMSIADNFDYPEWDIERLVPDYPENTIA